jgi:phenylpropionate dioxygenase-like ring-hydroxylating dioxygenase large terminal subunit
MYPFKEGSFAPRNAWYVAAFCEEIGEALLSRWILNEPVVLYRKADGTAVAVEGRCPHRHFPLGAGKRIGDAIQCAYHGITFDAGGKCILIPSQGSVPGVLNLRAYPLVERGMWAWIWTGDAKKADETLIPTLEEIDYGLKGFHAKPFYSQMVNGRYQLLNDNLLDLSHLGYLHASSIGTPDDAATPEERHLNDRRLRSYRNMKNAIMQPIAAENFPFDGPVDRVSAMDFFFPGFHAGISEITISEGHARAGEVFRTARVWHAVTPGTRTTTNYFFSMASPDRKGVDDAFEYLKPVVAEDVFATEEIEKMISMVDSLPQELMLKSDTTAVQGRRILQKMMDREACESSQAPAAETI